MTRTLEVLIIEADGASRLETIEAGHKPLQQLVGGYIEAIDAQWINNGPQITLWCNDEAKLIGLPPNYYATLLWYQLNPAVRGHDYICGPVVITGGPDNEGDTLPLPPEVKAGLTTT